MWYVCMYVCMLYDLVGWMHIPEGLILGIQVLHHSLAILQCLSGAQSHMPDVCICFRVTPKVSLLASALDSTVHHETSIKTQRK